VASAPNPEPWRIRTTMSIATCMLPAARAPPITFVCAATNKVHFRPILSAGSPPPSAPTQALKKRALTAPRIWFVYAAPGQIKVLVEARLTDTGRESG
jgi:hypothetical protein